MATSDKQRLSADTKRRLKEPEGVDADFKETPGSIKSDDLVAFANNRGGTIFVGVRETTGADGRQCGEVVGCEISDQARVSIINKATQCSPIVDVDVIAENISTRKPILRVEIEEGTSKPYGTSGGTYKRRVGGRRNVGMDTNMIKTAVMESETEEFINRFKSAGDEIIREVNAVHDSLASAIDSVQEAADQATAAAEEAAAAAEEAGQ